jgi:FtsP/CotA-like multicopper oxidase with cupredoxin domain
MGMAERCDVVVDFTGRAGQRIELRNRGVANSVDYPNTDKVLQFRVDLPLGPAPNPELAPAAEWPRVDPQGVLGLQESQAVRTRRLRFERQGGDWAINGLTWADVEASGLRRTFADPLVDTVEIWELQNNSGGWFHPIHVHLVDFRVLSRTGPRGVQRYEDGPKDVVYLGENETVRIIARFGPTAGRYMMHCHNTSHEDHDMMHQFRVVGPDEHDPLSKRAVPFRQPTC